MVLTTFVHGKYNGAAANYTNDTVRVLPGTEIEFKCLQDDMEFGDTMKTKWKQVCSCLVVRDTCHLLE